MERNRMAELAVWAAVFAAQATVQSATWEQQTQILGSFLSGFTVLP